MNATSIAEIFASGAERFPDALCTKVDPELFFIDESHSRGTTVRQKQYQKNYAKDLCGRCVHSQGANECLQYSIDHGIKFGIWGGLDEDERRALMNPEPRLSPREQQVLELRERGLSTRDVAERLNLSVQQVWQYHKTARKKQAA